MNVLKPIQSFGDVSALQGVVHDPVLFLAGSIEMGVAEMWQDRVIKDLAKYPGTILNPRRDDWDASWVQSITNDNFREQVQWELEGQELATHICFYFTEGTKSPITLMELGLACGKCEYDKNWDALRSKQDIVVCCPKTFWRRGNIEVMCVKYNLYLVEEYGKMIHILEQHMQARIKLKARYREHYARYYDLEIPKNPGKSA